ncbi:nicotinamide mononucleotide transporter [Desulfurobacterium atlanticum]|uniref:Nicotinamide mononucleotide transporter n=1 Tax=Desulfurobacterium atlanticum TaxID=240169 RepID=A0A238ZRL9_9BACT|nr:nicotinamide mononucleotide transporter [Desulfurobacterium atlanticum]SNR85701.1 nicotinamide mononucleotide transporter [Desulfurobacterium atlanticum]
MERTKGQKILEIVASAFGVTGLFITALGYPNIGFMVALCASTLYAVYAFKTKQYGILTSSIIYAIVEIVGIIHWTFGNGK